MPKHWTLENDQFLVAYFDAVGPMIGPHDLGRPEAATKARVRLLKARGGWQALEDMERARVAYLKAMNPNMSFEARECLPSDEEVA